MPPMSSCLCTRRLRTCPRSLVRPAASTRVARQRTLVAIFHAHVAFDTDSSVHERRFRARHQITPDIGDAAAAHAYIYFILAHGERWRQKILPTIVP